DRRMQMHVLVRVDMVENKAGRAKGLELRADLGGEPNPHTRREKISEPGAGLPWIEAPVAPHERAELGGRQYRIAVDQDEVQPDPQTRQATRPRDRVGGGRGSDHQAGAGQDSVAARRLDRLVDGDIAAEIVSADDQPALPTVTRRC